MQYQSGAPSIQLLLTEPKAVAQAKMRLAYPRWFATAKAKRKSPNTPDSDSYTASRLLIRLTCRFFYNLF